MSDHPIPAELEALLHGAVTEEKAVAAVRHFLRCPSCRTAISPRAAELLSPSARREPADIEDAALDRAVDRAFAAVRQVSREGSGQDPRHLRGLEGCRALLARSWELRHEDPRQMVELARLATELAEGLDPLRYGEEQVEDHRARAWIELANAQRVVNDYDAAERSLAEAALRLERGTGREPLRARYLDVRASLDGHRCRFAAAFAALDEVAAIHLRRGDTHLAGRALISKGIFKAYAGETAAAYEITRRGRTLLDKGREPVLDIQALHNEIGLLVDLGRFKEARALLWTHLDRLRKQGRIGRIKIRGLQGLIHAGLGQLDEAARDLEEARRELREAGLSYTAAVGALDLAAVYLQQGRAAEAQKVTREAAQVFEAMNIPEQGYLAVLLLQKAFEQDIASASLIRRTARFLRRVEHDPSATLDPRR